MQVQRTEATEACSKRMALINELPSEILTSIFGRTINTAYHPRDTRTSVSLTLTLCSVCSHWRDLITGIASFWSCIPMGNGTHAGNLTGLYLERSQNSALIDVAAFAKHGIDKSTWQAIDELRPHVHRIRSLSVFVVSFPQIYSLLPLTLTDQVPLSLIHLSLMVKPDNTYLPKLHFAPPYRQNFIRLCNQLQTLEMNNVWADLTSYSFDRLEKLILNVNHGFLDTMRCLSVAHNLCFLEIRGAATWRTQERIDPEPVHGVKILRLRQPHLFCDLELQRHPVLESKTWDVIDFHLPRNLAVGYEQEIRRNIELLIPYMRINSSKIVLLTLHNRQPQVLLEQMRSMLQVLPNLHTLTFDMLGLSEPTLSPFIPPPELPGAFPRIRTLRLFSSDVLHLDTFKALISNHPIQRLDLWHSRLDWDDGTQNRSYYPAGPSPFYEWLCERVPELYISKP